MKFFYDSEADIPAAVKAFYAKADDGKWHLTIDGERAEPSSRVREFRDKNVELLKQNDALTAKFKDVDPVKYADLIAREKDLNEGALIKKDGLEAAVEKRVADMKKDYEARLAAAAEIDSRNQAELAKLKIDGALQEAGAKHGIRPTALPDLFARGRSMFTLVDGQVVALEADGKTKRYGKDGQPLTIAEYVGSLTKEAGHLFEASQGGGASGAGSGGSATGGNPWDPKAPNLTRQGQIFRENPAEAARLAAQHGAKVPGA